MFRSGRKAAGTIRNLMSISFAREPCLCCGRTTFGVPVCRSCIDGWLMNFCTDFQKRCSVCGKELLSERGICTKCREENLFTHLDQVFPLFSYRLWIKKLIFEWKIGNRRSISTVFADLYRKALDCIGLCPGNCILVPVPPRPGKIRTKGWDQMADVCGILKNDHGFRVEKLLRRLSIEQQKKKDRNQRICMKGRSYGEARGWEKRIAILRNAGMMDATFVVVDDVITTGVTVDSCGEVLRRMGAKVVKAVSLVIVD